MIMISIGVGVVDYFVVVWGKVVRLVGGVVVFVGGGVIDLEVVVVLEYLVDLGGLFEELVSGGGCIGWWGGVGVGGYR